MNKDRRKEIKAVIAAIEAVGSSIQSISERIDEVRSDEESYRDEIPENLQGSDRYAKADASVDALSSAYDDLESLDLETIVGSLREAMDA